MRTFIIITIGLCFLFSQIAGGQSAHAQIVSQNPRPVIKADVPENVETTMDKDRIGQSGNLIPVPRAGALLFASFDHNDDYVIDTGEVNAGINRAFTFADKNKNGILSLIELEAWRLAALGSENAAPHNFAFAPNFARTVTKDKFQLVLSDLAAKLDIDAQGVSDGKISMADLLKNFSVRDMKQDEERSCKSRIYDERRRVEQQCRTNARRGY